MKTSEKLERAWQVLKEIPVCGIHVDEMYEVRLLLSDVHRELKEQEKQVEVRRNETS